MNRAIIKNSVKVIVSVFDFTTSSVSSVGRRRVTGLCTLALLSVLVSCSGGSSSGSSGDPDAGNRPVLDPIGDQATNEGASLSFLVTASDPNGTIPTLSATNLPGTASFIDNGDGSGTFNWDTSIGDNGTYPGIKFTASDGVLSDSEEITISLSIGQLSGSVVAPPLAVNLSGEGVTDWAHWGLSGDSSFDHLSTGGSQISDITQIGSVAAIRLTDAPVSYSWSDGAPTVSSVDTTTGVYVKGLNNGYEITVPADTTLRTLRVYLGVADAQARIEASLSDSSAPVYTEVLDISGASAQLVILDYRAESAGQVLTFRVTVEAIYESWGNVNLQSAMLFGPAVNNAPVLDPVGDRSTYEGASLNFLVTASDPDGTTPALSATNLPGTASFTDNGDGTGTFIWDTTIGDNGTYPGIQFTASDGELSDSENIVVTLSIGQLSGSLATPPATVSLSGESATDWAHWGLFGASSFDHSRKGGGQISDITPIGSAPVESSADAPVSYSWSDGIPTASSVDTTTGIFIRGVNNGYELTVPADTALRTLRMYMGISDAQVRIEAILSDGSAPDYVEVLDVTGVMNPLVTLDYKAASAAQELTFRVTVEAIHESWGNVNLQSAMLFGPPAEPMALPFSDDFSSGNLDAWSIVDDSDIAANWQLSGAALTQSVKVESVASFDESYHLGTNIYYIESLGLSDYSFSVDATQQGPIFEDIGILFRYQNSDNYYRFTMNPRYGFSRLEKKVGGNFTTLAANARGLVPAGTTATITAVVKGSQIHILLDGDPLFAVDDSSLSDGAAGFYSQSSAVFDNVLIENVSPAPAITLSSPVAHSVDTDNTLDVSALALNVPTGGYVVFTLDDGMPVVDSIAPYEKQYTGVSQGGHTLAAALFDVNGVELYRDTNIQVGVAGDYIVAIGDSITNGVGDDYAADNVSASGRVEGIQGYEAMLTDLLDSSESTLPHMVINEGVGGDETSDTIARIYSILSRNAGFNRVNILLGTNDAGGSMPVPSGAGCPGTIPCSGTFKGNMQFLLNALPAGTTASVALIPPAFGSADPLSSSRNNTVQEYNTVITDELAALLPNVDVGPDLFAAFLTNDNLFSLYSDNLHPNALGHALMAHLWHNTLNPGSPVDLPFILDNLTPTTIGGNIKQNLLEAGDRYYIDEDFTLSSVPAVLDGGVWVMTANADRQNPGVSYVEFDVDRPVTVYIAYDAGASATPGWLTGFTVTGEMLTVDGDALTSTFDLYSKDYPAGPVADLGGNLAPGASGADSNYLVIVKPTP